MLDALLAPRPELEVLDRSPAPGTPTGAPLLFVHGAYTSAHCWKPFFLDYFSSHGHRCRAVSLRGHGRSDGKAFLPFLSMRDYLADVRRQASALGKQAVLIGHSMGAMVLQMHLRSHKAAGVVLLSPVPPEGLVTSTLHMAMNHPRVLANLNLLQHLGTAFADAEMFRSALLRPNTPLQEVKPFLPFSQRESQRAIMDMCGLDLPWGTPLQGTPTLVVGGGADALFPPDAFRRAAWLHRADLEILPDFPHALMLDSQWETVAETVLDWLRLRGLSG